MTTIRIKGLVRLADRLRQEMAAPVSARRLEEIRQLVDRSLETVEEALTGRDATALPPPSRRAYGYLKALDLTRVVVVPEDRARERAESVRFPGLQRDLEALLEALAAPRPSRELQGRIVTLSDALEAEIRRHGIEARQLTPRSRTARGWLAWMAREDNFRSYLEAAARTRDVFQGRLAASRYRAPLWVQFRPLQPLYRVRCDERGTLLQMAMPMVAFESDTLQHLARMVLGHSRSRPGRDRQPLIEALTGPACQGVQAELEALEGLVEQGRGVHFDLNTLFEDLNGRYFAGKLERPRLSWSRSLTGRKFGHYDALRDTVMVSATLDQDRVPEVAVAFVLYHELLHKHHGIRWEGGRARVHTPAFTADEARFRGREQAEAVLKALARRGQPG